MSKGIGTRGLLARLAAVAMMLAPAQALAEGAKNPLVGTWRLKSWENQRSDGKTDLPYGKDPVGFITWTSGGRWMFLAQTKERASFAVPRIQGGTPEEKKVAYETSLAYGGTYVFDEKGKVVTLKVDASTFPNWTGTESKRFIEFPAPGRYVARSAPIKAGEVEIVAVLDWERLE